MKAHYLIMLSPTQWLKNLMLFFPPFLGGQLLVPGLISRGILPLGAFCLVSSAGYVFNDILDRLERLIHFVRFDAFRIRFVFQMYASLKIKPEVYLGPVEEII